MKQDFKVSIIVPVYNVDKYLRKCLDSIVGQTLKDREIIIINDGSTDSSLEIIKEYEAKDTSIKIIDKQNEGYGKTVNKGLDIARGEYIGIVESDDWVEPNMFEKLYNTAKLYNVDIVKSAHYEYNSKNQRMVLSSIPWRNLNKVITPIEESSIFHCGIQVWSYIYRKTFLNRNEIRFLETAGASYQDISFNFKVLSLAKSAYFLKDAFVHYRSDSVSSSINSKDKVFCVCDEFKEISNFLDERPAIKSKIKTICNRYKFGSYRWNYYRLNGKNRDLFAKRMKSEFKRDIENGNFDKSLYTPEDYRKYIYFSNYGNELYSMYYHFAKAIRFIRSIFFHVSVNNNIRRVFVFGIRVYKHKEYLDV
ncbi:hypothetical protein AGMMS49990_03490 [Endomicrobiia bacterium]|nr:hypothetical protein AGMMS49990_03490 [Endomicrobiia bacterium]